MNNPIFTSPPLRLAEPAEALGGSPNNNIGSIMRTKIQQILDSIKTFEIELYPGHQTYIYLNPEDCSLYGARSDVTPAATSIGES